MNLKYRNRDTILCQKNSRTKRLILKDNFSILTIFQISVDQFKNLKNVPWYDFFLIRDIRKNDTEYDDQEQNDGYNQYIEQLERDLYGSQKNYTELSYDPIKNRQIYEDNRDIISHRNLVKTEEVKVYSTKKQERSGQKVYQCQSLQVIVPKQIENILGVKTVQGKKYYVIKWLGTRTNDVTWEEEKDLLEYKDIIKIFEDTFYYPYVIGNKNQLDSSPSSIEQKQFKKNEFQLEKVISHKKKSVTPLKQNQQSELKINEKSRTIYKEQAQQQQKTFKQLKQNLFPVVQNIKVQDVIGTQGETQSQFDQEAPEQNLKSKERLKRLISRSHKSLKSQKSVKSQKSSKSQKSVKSQKSSKSQKSLKSQKSARSQKNLKSLEGESSKLIKSINEYEYQNTPPLKSKNQIIKTRTQSELPSKNIRITSLTVQKKQIKLSQQNRVKIIAQEIIKSKQFPPLIVKSIKKNKLPKKQKILKIQLKDTTTFPHQKQKIFIQRITRQTKAPPLIVKCIKKNKLIEEQKILQIQQKDTPTRPHQKKKIQFQRITRQTKD